MGWKCIVNHNGDIPFFVSIQLTQNELDANLNAIQSIEEIVACYEKIEKARNSLNTKDYSKIGLKINETQAEKFLKLTKISSFYQ